MRHHTFILGKPISTTHIPRKLQNIVNWLTFCSDKIFLVATNMQMDQWKLIVLKILYCIDKNYILLKVTYNQNVFEIIIM